MRPLRYVPPSDRGRLVIECTARTLQGRALLRPGGRFNGLYYGVLARAQQLYGTEVYAFCCPSTHHHLLLGVEDAEELARFMGFVQGNLAREAGRLHDWRGKLWSRRYRGILVDEDEASQVDRLCYILDQGCSKDLLVASPLDWPGPSSAAALVRGTSTLQGDWIDRTGLDWARRRGEVVEERDFTRFLELELSPLPCWRHLDRRERAAEARRLVELIEERTRAAFRAAGRRPVKVEAILARHPHSSPKELARSPAPPVHAKTPEGRRRLIEMYNEFVKAYRRAAAELRAGNLTVAFPQGSFPPPAPFIPLPRPP